VSGFINFKIHTEFIQYGKEIPTHFTIRRRPTRHGPDASVLCRLELKKLGPIIFSSESDVGLMSTGIQTSRRLCWTMRLFRISLDSDAMTMAAEFPENDFRSNLILFTE
jgi:hypothetical protein